MNNNYIANRAAEASHEFDESLRMLRDAARKGERVMADTAKRCELWMVGKPSYINENGESQGVAAEVDRLAAIVGQKQTNMMLWKRLEQLAATPQGVIDRVNEMDDDPREPDLRVAGEPVTYRDVLVVPADDGSPMRWSGWVCIAGPDEIAVCEETLAEAMEQIDLLLT
jgi:hypothetical protein